MVREEKLEDVEDKAELNAEDRLLDLLLPPRPPPAANGPRVSRTGSSRLMDNLDAKNRPAPDDPPNAARTREKLRQQFREGKLDDRMVEIDVRERNMPPSRSSPTRASRRWTSTSRTCCPTSSASAPRSAR
jgi:ATP-dependent HslUV protease ATP-binding subunit HslU